MRFHKFLDYVQSTFHPMPSAEQREQIEMKALKTQVQEYKAKLKTWPPVRVELQKPKATHRFQHTHHAISRIDVTTPIPVLGEFGLPKRRFLDCMIR